MRGLIIKTILTSTVLIASALLATSWANAGQPVKSTFTDSGTAVLTDIAEFPITVDYSVDGTAINYFDRSGALTRVSLHMVEQDTFSAHGKSLVGEPYTYNIEIEYDTSGNPIRWDSAGIASKVRLPDGGLFISAGKIDWLGHPGVNWLLATDKGSCVNLEDFIEALSE